jgi:hypothetical protein
MSRAVLVLMVVVLSCLAARTTAAAGLGAPDRRARAQARAVLERARTPEHRRLFRMVVPAVPSGLPERYTVRHHANFIAFVPSSRAIDIERDADGARVELLDPEGSARAPLPVDELDALVRLAFYLHHARAESRDEGILMGSWSYASHMPSHQVRIEGEGLSVTTVYTQPITDEISGHELEQFVLTEVSKRLEALVDAYVTPAHRVPLDEAALADAERRLRAIPRGPTPLSQYDRDDRDAVVARLLAQQLVDARVERAVPLLQRKGLDEQAFMLSLHTTAVEDLPQVLPGLLCSDEWDLHQPALALAEEHREQSREAVLHALGCRLSDDKRTRLLRELAATPPPAGRSLRVLRPLLSGTRSAELRLEVARALWVIEHDEAAQRLLRSLALGRGRMQRLDDAQTDALSAFAAGIGRTGRERRAVAELALEILRGVPMDRSSERLSVAVVMEKVWQFGNATDAEGLLPWVDHPDAGLASDAVELIDRLDPERARAEARQRIRSYAEGGGRADYAHAVGPFVQLLVRHDDRAVLDDLRAAEVPLQAEAPVASDPRRRAHAALVRCLEATPEHKATAILRWLEHTPEVERYTYELLRERHPSLDDEAFDRAQAVATGEADQTP